MTLLPLVRSAWQSLRELHCFPLILLALACLIVREQFPFSNFPMYSSFTNKTSYVYLADGAGQPIAAPASTGLRTSQLKKIYDREVRKEEQPPGRPRRLQTEEKRTAGERVLATIKNSQWVRGHSKLPPVLRLYEVSISLREGHFEKQSLLVAEVP